MKLRRLMCDPGASRWRQDGYDFPCGLAMVTLEDAARLLGRDRERVRELAVETETPVTQDWVAAHFVRGLWQARRLHEIRHAGT